MTAIFQIVFIVSFDRAYKEVSQMTLNDIWHTDREYE